MKIFLSFLLLALGLSLQIPAQTKTKSTPALYVEYHSSQKNIVIENNIIIITEAKEEYDNPVSSMPSKRTEVTKKATLPKTKLDSLNMLIRKSGFMSLPKNEYGISANERFYPYTIKVISGKVLKKVLYRSNPSGEVVPKPFSDIEKKLNEIVNSITSWQ
ncbi:MAG TPA: hypothetical protein VNW99_11180 [Cytophagaceae bacterium]|jgi:hypothetical protein|nr:hypothetical protein [Cytophagaceae bacterium]